MTHKTRYHRLRALFQLTVSLAAGRAYGCGPCPGPTTTAVPLLPDGNGPDGGSDAGGGPDELDCRRVCGEETRSCKLADQTVGGALIVECTSIQSCGAGRAHATHRREVFSAPNPVAAYFAETALLERASVPAFRGLLADLSRAGAPASLRARVRRAIADEARHTRVMRRLASAQGARLPRAARHRPSPHRPLTEIAKENAVEGCARETFAALVATIQAERAAPAFARTFGKIAQDETRHAALAHDVHAWLLTRLDARERVEVEVAYTAALEGLTRTFLAPPEAARRALGLPTASEARALGYALRDALLASG